jgi:hypothetical protein
MSLNNIPRPFGSSPFKGGLKILPNGNLCDFPQLQSPSVINAIALRGHGDRKKVSGKDGKDGIDPFRCGEG